MQYLDHWGNAISSAGGIRDDAMADRVILLLIYPQDDSYILTPGWGSDDDLLSPPIEVS